MNFDNDFYKNIIDDFSEGVAICDADQKVVYVNKKFEYITGFSKEELLNKDFSFVVKSSKACCHKCSQEAVVLENDKNKSYYLGELTEKDGRETCVRVNFSKTQNGETVYLIIPLSDVAFLNKAHVDFVSTVSHELRTPLTSIKGFADTLLVSGDKINADQQKRFLSIIKSQVDRLTRLVEDLLTVSKLESKKDKLIYKAIELNKFIENIVYGIQLKAQKHKIELDIKPNLPPIWADSDKFEQIITNLLDNAIKYSNIGTKVRLEAKFCSDNSDFMEINVKDQGVGIPEEFLSKIFTKFSRIDNPLTRQVEGTGLGLYITKSLVEGMGGKISVSSSKEGSTFSLRFPVATLEKPIQKKF